MDMHHLSQEQQQQQHLMGADNLPSGPSLQLANEQEVVRKAGRYAISAFLDSHNCFSVLRASGKVVVFDTRIPIQLAFYALVEHGTCVSAYPPTGWIGNASRVCLPRDCCKPNESGCRISHVVVPPCH
jgi:hypothetical protein